MFNGITRRCRKNYKSYDDWLTGLIVVLAVHGLTLDNAMAGVKFYLYADFNKIKHIGLLNVIVAAMNQSFFTLSIGIGSMAIFGSYLKKDKTLLGEAVNVAGLDTFVAIVAGLIIFPACFSFGVNPDSGPSLIFITLPNVFLSMTGGRIWGALFFLFMAFASLSTVIAVFENIIACTMELWNFTRKKSVIINLILITVFSLPCALGFNVLNFLQPLGSGSTILDLEDFIVSNLLLPLGSFVYLLFCTSRLGWGFRIIKQKLIWVMVLRSRTGCRVILQLYYLLQSYSYLSAVWFKQWIFHCFFVISPKLYGIYYIEEDHSMKKSRIEHVKKYSMLSLVEDLGFTLVYESSNYYHLRNMIH